MADSSNPGVQNRLKRVGWTVERALDAPEERYPVPSPPYPPGRFYHFVADRSIALVVSRNEIIASLPGHEAWDQVQGLTPEAVPKDRRDEKTGVVMRYNSGPKGSYVTPDADISAPWLVQCLVTPDGVWTVCRPAGTVETVTILLGSEQVATLNINAVEEHEEFPDALVELAWATFVKE